VTLNVHFIIAMIVIDFSESKFRRWGRCETAPRSHGWPW